MRLSGWSQCNHMYLYMRTAGESQWDVRTEAGIGMMFPKGLTWFGHLWLWSSELVSEQSFCWIGSIYRILCHECCQDMEFLPFPRIKIKHLHKDLLCRGRRWGALLRQTKIYCHNNTKSLKLNIQYDFLKIFATLCFPYLSSF